MIGGKGGGGRRVMFHAALKGIDYSECGIWMVGEVVEDPGCGGAFESADLEDPQPLRAKREGQLCPVLNDVLVEPVLRKGKPATI